MQMRLRNIIIFLLISFLFCGLVSAQEPSEKKDTTTLYRNIESFSKQSKVKTFIYRLVFRPVCSADQEKRTQKKRV